MSHRNRLIPAALLGLQLLAAPAWSAGFEVNIASREAARNFYNALYPASANVPIAWNGATGTCQAGDTSAAYKEAVRLRVNFFRAMAGVPASIVFDPEYNRKAQASALMIAANRDVSHTPPDSWRCYSAEGAEAAGSGNLALASAGADAVSGYIEDGYANNYTVGHRRWLLYPQTQVMGTGDVITADYTAANTLWVFDSAHYQNARPAVRDGFVAWPPPGYVPYPLVFARWSFSYPGADFSQAQVSMSQQGQTLDLAVETLAQGYGENTLVWRPALDLPAAVSQDTAYQVSLNNVLINGQSRDFNYTVIVFDPAQTGPDSILPVMTGPLQAGVGQENLYTFTAVPGADSYQWRQARRQAAQGDGAENGATGVVDGTSGGYSLISNETAASGAASFHLAHPQPGEQSFTLAQTFLPGAQATLSFASRLGWASTDQIAKVEISQDSGASWQTLYQQAGSDGRGEPVFSTRSLSLAAYAGATINLRFSYTAGLEGVYYPQTSGGAGWYVDNIAFQDTETLTFLRIAQAGQDSFSFEPTVAGGYVLQTRALLYGQYPLAWGPVFTLAASGEALPADRVFAWAESVFPRHLDTQLGKQRGTQLGYYYRHYPASNTYVGEKEGRVYYFAPGVSPGIINVGALADFLRQAEAAGF